MADIEIEIDGRKLTAKPGETLMQVADAAGIYIPRFCYHKHLSIAANCRMCLVEVEKSPKTLPACATPVMAGMKVFTQSAKTIESQRIVMEFLLINHPLDCPICDQGGECELQDLAMGYGSGKSAFHECKRSVVDQNLGPLIATEMTRCILCTRCVRFGDEIAGMREIGDTYRGEEARIGTYIQHAIRSHLSGNIIDLCPVGALTSKPFRFTARAWELAQAPSVSPHDCLGSNLSVHTREGKVMRVVVRENPAINETWLSDRDRFSYTGLYHPDRLEEPIAKIDGVWQVIEWQNAFEMAAAGLQEVLVEHGADKIGALASPNSTLEEFYLLQKIIRGLGSPHIDHRLREIDTQDQMTMAICPGLRLSIASLSQCDAILLIGSNLQKEQPLIATRVRKAALQGAAVCVVNPVDYALNFTLAAKKIVAPHHMGDVLAAIAKALSDQAVGDTTADADHDVNAIAAQLRDKQKISILLGALALHHQNASVIRYLAQEIAAGCKGEVGLLTDGANTAGGFLAGAIPHRHAGGTAAYPVGLSAYDMLKKPRRAYVLLNVEPDLDCANALLAIEAIKQAKCVIALSMYRNPILEAHADVIFPMAAFTETSGTFINAEGTWQSIACVAKPYAKARPGWKILRVLGNFLTLEGFHYESSEAILDEVKTYLHKMGDHLEAQATQPFLPKTVSVVLKQGAVSRIGEIPLYALDSLVRRAVPLQEAQTIVEGDLSVVRLNPMTASKLHLQEGDQVKFLHSQLASSLPVILDNRIAVDAVWVPGGLCATSAWGDLFGTFELQRI